MKNLQNFVYEKVGSTHIFQTAEMYTKSFPNFLKFSKKMIFQQNKCPHVQNNKADGKNHFSYHFQIYIVNTTFFNGKVDRVPAHVDHDYKHRQLLLYLDNSSGETVILDKKNKPYKIVRPEKFKADSFDSVPHYHYFPINSVRRVVVYTFE